MIDDPNHFLMDLDQAGASRSELLIATCEETKFHTASRRNGAEAGSTLFTPGERPRGVKIFFGVDCTPTPWLAALSTKFVDGTWDK